MRRRNDDTIRPLKFHVLNEVSWYTDLAISMNQQTLPDREIGLSVFEVK